ncbi:MULTISPECIES: MSC_0624 family F1-like ATPase-associated membrane protein [unclassified Mycoplasma]|uniref:MSC_0624 family F1-like ATPase-associated membrane protein n=1 Tax=unclassified Mycoplasma TaxID=2683645 RepID=UPI00211B93C6|nr:MULTISPECIES: hypothetical protein [unclassified Mycoplasma]UUM19667.1 hypothetical protein NPA11_02765 [Mycoplasma sp. 1578d]UUM24635.1 hypothetical protein NPA12_02985 [Mycoplasma sp. 3686d]
MKLVLTKKVHLWFDFSKENILKLSSFIATFVLFSFFVLSFSIQLSSPRFVLHWSNIFNSETITNKSYNFLALGTFVILTIIALASLFKSFMVLSNNNLKFKHYIAWYVNYLTLAIVCAGIYGFMPHQVTSKPIDLFYKSLVIFWYLLISIGYQIHVLVFRSKHLINISKHIVLSTLEYVFKLILAGTFIFVLYLFVSKTPTNDALYFNNDVINYLDGIKSKTPGLYFVFIFLITLFIISIIMLKFLNIQAQKESLIAWKNKITSILAFAFAILIGIFILAIYLTITSKNSSKASITFIQQLDYIYLIILGILFIGILTLIILIKLYFEKIFKISKKNSIILAINSTLVILSLMSILNLLKVNFYTQQFSNLIILTTILISIIFIVQKKYYLEKTTLIAYSIVLSLLTIASVLNCFEYTSINFQNNSLIYSSSDFIYSARISIAASALLFVEIIRKSSKKVFLLIFTLLNLKLIKGHKE